ncbi:MAG: hypothetical protein M3422_01375 [Actinomycetota bacterium]|nr:hypothetical protein [Actinomycetota bacterium]
MTAITALGTWALNIVVGLAMLLRWRTRPLPRIVVVHLAIAASGLALWVTYLAVGEPAALAWATFAWLNVINGLGDVVLMRGWRARHDRGSGPRDYLRASKEAMSGKRKTVMTHGLVAGATYVLVLLAALGVGN